MMTAERPISVPGYLAHGSMVQFFPVSGMVGFSHRVVVDGVRRDWLSNDAKPNAKSAEYFAMKHMAGKED